MSPDGRASTDTDTDTDTDTGTGTGVLVDHGGVRLHVLDNGRSDRPAPPVVVVPGMAEAAREYRWLLERLGDRRVLAVDLRGRGDSDAPATGYAWEDHIGDLRAAVTALGLRRPVLVAFSRGSSYALGYALRYPDQVAGLVVGDYWARHVRPPDAVVERQLSTRIRGVPMSERMPRHAARAVFAEARDHVLWDRLPELRCPVLVIRGGRRGAVVTDEVATQWRDALPTVRLATVENAGHDLWSRDRDAYLAALLPFLAALG
ncbi:putative hydrolase or acyltransferase of alpha/beta superfamily [Frankia sp. EI5c]|uniref:alpha/beta fold hydrolase n=1 Tax=Frankia sp. EI5c TaxID=683316 RepID=UPI0007C30FE6|nr:alpha/beta fold hydrolase [Frankia sp. EI5c]OAA25856.1 putative hydrolase or acyltransferase of alpha/beta superfamily [Frankia sp. EI5c]